MVRILIALSLISLVAAGCNKADSKSNTDNNAQAGGSGAMTPENTTLEWTGTKPKGKHDGGFKQFSGSVKPADKDFTAATISLEIDTDSLYSDNGKLTNHLKSPDFFEVKKYPKATFVSTAIKEKKEGDNTHEITGDLTLHGATKAITFPARVTQTDDAINIDSTFTFDRTEHGITYAPDKVDRTVTVRVKSKVSRK